MGEVNRALVNASYTAHAIAMLWQLIFSLASVHVAVFVAVSSVAVVSITATVSFERLSPRSRVTRVDLNIS